MHVSEEIKEIVGFLFADVFRDRGDGFDKKPMGTCFFVRDVSPDGIAHTFTIVTAKHVVRSMKNADGDWYVRLNRVLPPDGPGGVEYVPIPKTGWIDHPDAAVDLTILPWMPPRTSYIEFTTLRLDGLGVVPPPLIEARATRGETEPLPWPPPEGEEAWLTGLLLQHHGTERNYPVFRIGHVALMTDEMINGAYGLSHYYLVEIQVYPGHSGSPVFARYEDYLIFLGVLSAGFPSEDLMLRPSSPSENTSSYWSLGIGMVVPYYKVLELMDMPDVKKAREANWLGVPGAVPLGADADGTDGVSRNEFLRDLTKVTRPVEGSEQASS